MEEKRRVKKRKRRELLFGVEISGNEVAAARVSDDIC